MRIALTGASGYVGSLIAAGLASDMQVVRLGRHPEADDVAWSLERPDARLPDRLAASGAEGLVHAAWDMRTSSAADVRRTCIEGSLSLLRAAEIAGLRRLVFISTISAFPGARSAYGRAKLAVEEKVLARGGIVLRLGLVHGGGEGGLFGTIRRSVRESRIVPMIGDGGGPQYLLDAARLQAAVRRALAGELDDAAGPITLADEVPYSFRDLVRRVANESGRRPLLVPVPWRLLYLGLRTAEASGFHLPVRSDSVLSFVHANRAPDFSETRRLGM